MTTTVTTSYCCHGVMTHFASVLRPSTFGDYYTRIEEYACLECGRIEGRGVGYVRELPAPEPEPALSYDELRAALSRPDLGLDPAELDVTVLELDTELVLTCRRRADLPAVDVALSDAGIEHWVVEDTLPTGVVYSVRCPR